MGRSLNAITHLEMLEQLLPLIPFDEYFILSDLIGVPDLFARVIPILKKRPAHGPPGPVRHRPSRSQLPGGCGRRPRVYDRTHRLLDRPGPVPRLVAVASPGQRR
jgi:hypothetical protein